MPVVPTLVERLRSNEPLPICPYDRKSPEYWTTPDDAPCKFCGGLPDGPDKCRGADTRIMAEAADRIALLEGALRPDLTFIREQAESLSADKSEDAIGALAWNLLVYHRRLQDRQAAQALAETEVGGE